MIAGRSLQKNARRNRTLLIRSEFLEAGNAMHYFVIQNVLMQSTTWPYFICRVKYNKVAQKNNTSSYQGRRKHLKLGGARQLEGTFSLIKRGNF